MAKAFSQGRAPDREAMFFVTIAKHKCKGEIKEAAVLTGGQAGLDLAREPGLPTSGRNVFATIAELRFSVVVDSVL